jgi:hypothetical protein
MEEARRFRDELLARLPPPTKIKRRFSLNTSGVIGVTLSRERSRAGTLVERYLATWPTANGKRCKVSFSVGRYGHAEARRLAIKARKEGLQRELGAASLKAPSQSGWKFRHGKGR